MDWLSHFHKSPRKTFVVHGEEETALGFGALIQNAGGGVTQVPSPALRQGLNTACCIAKEMHTERGPIFWARVGKCALDNPDLPIEFVRDLLISKNMDKSLAEPFEFEGIDA